MKKIVSIAVAIALVLSMAVVAFADKTLFTADNATPAHNAWWAEWTELNDNADFLAAVKTDGAKIVIKTDAAAATDGFQYGFQDTTTWVNVLIHSNFAAGEGNLAAEDVTVDGDYAIITVDAAALMAAAEAAGAPLNTFNWIIGSSTGNTYSIAVIVAEAPAPETTAPETTAPETTTPAPATETTKAPATGLALAVVPAVMALAAVAVSKKH